MSGRQAGTDSDYFQARPHCGGGCVQKTILVVDDDELVRYGLARALKTEDVSVATASTASDAVLKLSACPYDLCLLDVHLPDFSGMVLMKIIKDICPNVRVIIMTASHIDDQELGENIREAMANGACHFVAKPFNLSSLKDIVVQALHQDDSFHTGFRFSGDRFLERKARQRQRRPLRGDLRYSMNVIENGQGSRLRLLAKVIDVSEHGVGFVTDYPLRPSQVLSFEDDALRRTGVVAWSTILEDGTCRAGVSFA
jgi:CheY-like chemotaxis protein